MASKLSMDEQHRADSRLERELRGLAQQLDWLADRPRIHGTKLASACRELAIGFRKEANHIVQAWD